MFEVGADPARGAGSEGAGSDCVQHVSECGVVFEEADKEREGRTQDGETNPFDPCILSSARSQMQLAIPAVLL